MKSVLKLTVEITTGPGDCAPLIIAKRIIEAFEEDGIVASKATLTTPASKAATVNVLAPKK